MPTFTKIDYKTLVEDAEDIDIDDEQDHVAYEFSRKTFYEDDNAGVYNDNPN